MRVLVAPDKFKGTLTSEAAAQAMAEGVRRAFPDAVVTALPVADGGEGTVEALRAAGAELLEVTVHGPLQGPQRANVAVLGDVAFVQAADACGLQHLDPSPNTALFSHTYGVGELLIAAARPEVRTIVVGLGGSASTDGGVGMAAALGARCEDATGATIPPGGAGLQYLTDLNTAAITSAIGDRSIVGACDVRNPLLGASGAASVFGPQKGAGPNEIAQLEAGLAKLAQVMHERLGVLVVTSPGSGAAGGLGAGLRGFLGAKLTPGADLLLDALHFQDHVQDADLVLTGEGLLDSQSLEGKAPIAVARAAARAEVPALAIAGRCLLKPEEVRVSGLRAATSLTAHVGVDAALSDAWNALAQVTASTCAAWLAANTPR